MYLGEKRRKRKIEDSMYLRVVLLDTFQKRSFSRWNAFEKAERLIVFTKEKNSFQKAISNTKSKSHEDKHTWELF